VELALTDAGVAWSDVQSAFGGSWAVSADPLTSLVGLTGLPFINVLARARPVRHDPTGRKRHPRRTDDIVMAVAWTSTLGFIQG